LDHEVVFLGAEVVEIVVTGIDGFLIVMHLVVKVRTGGFTGITDERDDISALYFFAFFREDLGAVRITRGVVEAMINLDRLAVALPPSGIGDDAVTGSEDIGSDRRGEVHALVETADMIDGVHTPAVTGRHTLEVFVEHRLDGGYMIHADLLVLRHLEYLIVRACLDVKLFLEDIDLTVQVGAELGVGHAGDRVVVRYLPYGTHARGEGDGFGTEDSPVEVIVALGEVGHDDLHLIDLRLEQFHLRGEVAVVLHERRLARGREEIKEGIEEDDADSYTAEDIPSGTAQPITEAVLDTLELKRFRINTIFSHNYLRLDDLRFTIISYTRRNTGFVVFFLRVYARHI